MPKQRQRTLLEYIGSSSPAKQSSPPKGRIAPIEIESDDEDSDPGRIKFERDVSKKSDQGHSDRGEDGRAATPRRSARLQGTRKGVLTSSSPSPSTSPESEVLPKKSNRAGRNKRLVVTSDESDDHKTAKRRRLVKGKRPESHSDAEEDENLVDEVDEAKILTSRLRSRPTKTDFVRNLERLQRRRRGEESASQNEDSEDDDFESSLDLSHATSGQVFEGAHPTVNDEENDPADDDTSLNADNDDFIVQDDDDEEVPELPTLFSMGTFQDLSHHFKVICQLFVHLAVKAPRQRRTFMEQEMKKDYFAVPFVIAQRKLSAMKDSLVTSSIWKPDFKTPLESLPEFRLESLEFSVPRCDACHIGNRIATLRGIIRGGKYDRSTFELLEENVLAESDEIEWNLGRFCAARAQVFHLFSHWEYILFHSLREEVERLQEALSPSKKSRVFLPATQGPPPPDDPNDADGIMDWLDGRGIINLQWVRVKSMMDRARKLEVGKEAGDDLEIL